MPGKRAKTVGSPLEGKKLTMAELSVITSEVNFCVVRDSALFPATANQSIVALCSLRQLHDPRQGLHSDGLRHLLRQLHAGQPVVLSIQQGRTLCGRSFSPSWRMDWGDSRA